MNRAIFFFETPYVPPMITGKIVDLKRAVNLYVNDSSSCIGICSKLGEFMELSKETLINAHSSLSTLDSNGLLKMRFGFSAELKVLKEQVDSIRKLAKEALKNPNDDRNEMNDQGYRTISGNLDQACDLVALALQDSVGKYLTPFDDKSFDLFLSIQKNQEIRGCLNEALDKIHKLFSEDAESLLIPLTPRFTLAMKETHQGLNRELERSWIRSMHEDLNKSGFEVKVACGPIIEPIGGNRLKKMNEILEKPGIVLAFCTEGLRSQHENQCLQASETQTWEVLISSLVTSNTKAVVPIWISGPGNLVAPYSRAYDGSKVEGILKVPCGPKKGYHASLFDAIGLGLSGDEKKTEKFKAIRKEFEEKTGPLFEELIKSGESNQIVYRKEESSAAAGWEKMVRALGDT